MVNGQLPGRARTYRMPGSTKFLVDCGPREAHEIFLLWYYRIGLYRSYVKGWKISPSHYLNQDLARVWLDK